MQGVFYKTFTRPVAKCLLTALFVYQVIYWGWSKLEVDEIKEERQGKFSSSSSSPVPYPFTTCLNPLSVTGLD